ncbi:hypothetical protein LCGC14_0251230 [marine sediment metagenome]|uniref:Uncharacterized protein n=1 Tax=marine sediment metagenome TaxID=412755 RepID=A0A0F9WPF3_9ZZZZ
MPDRLVIDPTAENTFFRCHAVIMAMDVRTVRDQLLKLGRWPADRAVLRVLDWEEAVTRLKSDADSMLALTRMVVAIEDPAGRLYLVRTPDLVSGVPDVHRHVREEQVRRARDEVGLKA